MVGSNCKFSLKQLIYFLFVFRSFIITHFFNTDIHTLQKKWNFQNSYLLQTCLIFNSINRIGMVF